jgi:hypothetical protein
MRRHVISIHDSAQAKALFSDKKTQGLSRQVQAKSEHDVIHEATQPYLHDEEGRAGRDDAED